MKFIAFGCWNKDMCQEDGINGMSLVLRDIYEKKNLYNLEKIYLLGDNYYPPKNEKKEKQFVGEEFISGFQCLDRIDVPKDLIWGNHESGDEFKEGEIITKCKTMGSIIDMLKENPNYNIFKDVSDILEVNTLILKIDTTIYEDYEDIEAECYDLLFPQVEKSGNPQEKINRIRKYQLDKMIEKIIKHYDSFNKLIIFGHHPLCFAKTKIKKGKMSLKTGYSRLINDLAYIISTINLSQKEINYVCADVHFYERSVVRIENKLINQYIVGTGGAILDDPISYSFYDGITIKVDDSKDPIICDYTYTIYDQKKEFGYLFYDDTFNFISVNQSLATSSSKKYLIEYK